MGVDSEGGWDGPGPGITVEQGWEIIFGVMNKGSLASRAEGWERLLCGSPKPPLSHRWEMPKKGGAWPNTLLCS